MPLPKERIYTIDDIYALPDGERAELIDGQIYMMAPPSTRHQRLVGSLHAQIYNYIKSKNGKCEVDSEMECGWERIYRRLKEIGRLDALKCPTQIHNFATDDEVK